MDCLEFLTIDSKGGIAELVIDFVAKACKDLNEVRRLVQYFIAYFKEILVTAGALVFIRLDFHESPLMVNL